MHLRVLTVGRPDVLVEMADYKLHIQFQPSEDQQNYHFFHF